MYLVFIQEKGQFASTRFPRLDDAVGYAKLWHDRGWDAVIWDTEGEAEISFSRRGLR